MRRAVLVVAVIAAATTVALLVPLPANHPPPAPAPPVTADELVVYVRPGPIVYFPGPDGAFVGFDADLVAIVRARAKDARSAS